MRVVVFILSFLLAAHCFSQCNVCGDYVKAHEEMWTKLTLKPDSTFEYLHVFMGKQEETGRWAQYGNTLILTGCHSCNIPDSEPIHIKGQIPRLTIWGPFPYKYINIRGDSLFIIKPFNKVEPRVSLIKRKPK